MSQIICKLPKLNLPIFSGNPLHWQSFWDSFDTAVHRNPTLSGIQKFNYLKAQLKDKALHSKMGLAISLLTDRFGQPHLHMQALLDITSPDTQLESLQKFYDTLETNIRALASLGKAQETYGDLLIPIILGKIPNEIQRNLPRDQISPDLTIDQLRHARQKELRMLDAGKFVNKTENKDLKSSITSPSTRVSLTIPQHRIQLQDQRLPHLVFITKTHSSKHCQTVTDYQKRLEIVKKDNLCFNCLGHHKASKCQSIKRCVNCNRKHHTSLCSKKNQPSWSGTQR